MTPVAFSRPLRIACWVAFAVALLANLVTWTDSRGAALGHGHAFRQFQTAVTARYLARDGFKVAYETPVLGPPWSIPMEFPIYQYTVAAVVRVTGMSLESAGRAVSIGYFWAALPAVWLLLGLWRVARETRLLALALLLSCPVYLFYGRHFMIETTALALGLWFLWAFARAIQGGSIGHGALALALGIAGSLAKITTFFSFGLAAALIMAVEIKIRPREWLRLLAWSGLIVLPSLVLSVLWVRYADGLKAQNPVGDFLVSSKLQAFNFGTFEQRFDPATWSTFYQATRQKVATELVLAFALVGAALAPLARRWLLGAGLLCFVAVLGVFTNLFFVHDYYFEATAVFLLVALAVGLEGLLTSTAIPLGLRVAIPVLVIVSQLTRFWGEFGGQFTGPPPGQPPLAALINRLTEADDVVAVIGQDWNAGLVYFADRRGLMVRNGMEENHAALQRSVSLLGPRRIGALVITGHFRDNARGILTLTRMMDLAPRPSIEGQGAQVYLPKARLPAQVARATDAEFPGFEFNRDYDPAKDLLAAEAETDLTQPAWQGKFPMTSPAPQRATGLFPISFADQGGAQVIGTHAPNTIYFQPPAGAQRLEAVGGLFAGAYEGAEFTDGVVIEVWETLPDGRPYMHFQRELLPHERPADRAEFTIELNLDRPFAGPLSLRVDPGPTGRINFDWFYWRSVKIH
jgi:hypothetical protein